MSGGKRRLAGILAADVVGYSAMVAADEPASLARVRALRTEIVEPAAAAHDGRLFKTMGDGFLLEFASAVQALRCAIAIQTAVNAQPDGLRLRIGVHQGEVVAEGDDLFGDGVIIAARLEPLAEHGGIVISSRVKEDASGKRAVETEDLGEPELKNIAAKIRAFRVRLDGGATAPARPTLALPGKPSIAILAFVNMSGDAEQEYFSDGISEDIITQLSRDSGLFVTARGSSFTYKGRATDIKQIARELGVRYVLEGSVRRGGERLRISAQLVDAETGNQIWAERFDRTMADLFAVQDEISEAVAVAIGVAVTDAEVRRAMRRPPRSLGAWELYHQGLWHAGRVNVTANDEARRLIEQAIAIDPMFAAAHGRLSVLYGYAVIHYRNVPKDEGLRLNLLHARRAVELDPADADGHAHLAIALLWHGDMENALLSARRALSISPNCAQGHMRLGMALVFNGENASGRAALAEAARLSPRDPSIADMNIVVIQSHYFERDYEQSVAVCRQQLVAFPDYPITHHHMAKALAQLGRVEEAHAALAVAKARLGPTFDPAFLFPWLRPEDHEHVVEGFRKAGWEG
jgi:adenylate cyclase